MLEFVILKRHFFWVLIVFFFKFEFKIVGIVRLKAKLMLLINFKRCAKKQFIPFPFIFFITQLHTNTLFENVLNKKTHVDWELLLRKEAITISLKWTLSVHRKYIFIFIQRGPHCRLFCFIICLGNLYMLIHVDLLYSFSGSCDIS